VYPLSWPRHCTFFSLLGRKLQHQSQPIPTFYLQALTISRYCPWDLGKIPNPATLDQLVPLDQLPIQEQDPVSFSNSRAALSHSWSSPIFFSRLPLGTFPPSCWYNITVAPTLRRTSTKFLAHPPQTTYTAKHFRLVCSVVTLKKATKVD
jgi:hypothetical protein